MPASVMMQAMIVQHPARPDFSTLLEESGWRCEVIASDDLEDASTALSRCRPDLIFATGLTPELYGGNVPTVHYEQGKITDWAAFEKVFPGRNDFLFLSYRGDVHKLSKLGVAHVWHLPSCPRLAKTCKPQSKVKAETVFAGSLFIEQDNPFRRLVGELERASSSGGKHARQLRLVRKRLLSLVDAQERASHRGDGWIIPRLLEEMESPLRVFFEGIGLSLSSLSFVIGKEAARRDRLLHLAAVPKLNLMGPEDPGALLPDAAYRGNPGLTAMPAGLYARAALAVYIPRCYAEDGLSPRVFDILQGGGFLLARRQDELARLFVEGRHYEGFSDLEEMRGKAAFYVANPKKRLAIAQAGHGEVLASHQPASRLAHILSHLHLPVDRSLAPAGARAPGS